MKKLYSLLIVLILTISCFCIAASADDVAHWTGSGFDPSWYLTPPMPSETVGSGHIYVYDQSGRNTAYSVPDDAVLTGTFINGNDYLGRPVTNLSITSDKTLTYLTSSYNVDGNGNALWVPPHAIGSGTAKTIYVPYYGALDSSVPITLDDGTIIGPQPSPFHLAGYLDANLVYHFSVMSDDTIGSNDVYPVTTYLIDGSLSTPNHSGVSYPVYSPQQIPHPDITYVNFWEMNFPDFWDWYLQSYLYHGDNAFKPWQAETGAWKRVNYYTSEVVESGTTTTSSFDITDYDPYIFIGDDKLSHHHNPSSDFSIDVPALDNMQSLGGLYKTDVLAFIAVIDVGQGESYVLRYDFKRSDVMALRHTPNYIVAPITPINPPSDSTGEVTDLSSLADYIQYVYNITNNNTAQDFQNLVSDLQNIPWSDFITDGMLNFTPTLSSEFDTLFGSLFDDWFIPSDSDISELQADIDRANQDFFDKFSWHRDVLNEVNFIIQSFLSSGVQSPEFSVMVEYGEGDDYVSFGYITFFDGDWFDPAIISKFRQITNVFCTLGLIFYIYRTLPSTIGREPN